MLVRCISRILLLSFHSMRHISITAFLIRILGLALIVILLRDAFDVGIFGDALAEPSLGSEPSFRFEGIYLLHATRGFYVTAFYAKLLGSLILFVFPRFFARILWLGILSNPNHPNA